MDKLRLAVIGSRTFNDRERLYRILDANIDKIEIIISGGAKGADSLANEWCKDRGKPIKIFYPQWYSRDGELNKGAGLKRNWSIIKESNKVLCFWDGESKGTKHSIDIAKELGISIKIIHFSNDSSNGEDKTVPVEN